MIMLVIPFTIPFVIAVLPAAAIFLMIYAFYNYLPLMPVAGPGTVVSHWLLSLRTNLLPLMGVVAAIFAILFAASALLLSVNPTSPTSKFWLQTLAGNWSPDSFPPLLTPIERPPILLSAWDEWAYAFAAILAILLNNATIIFVIGVIWRLLVDRRRKMKLIEALAARDIEIEVTLLKKLSDVLASGNQEDAKKIIHQAITDARRNWEGPFLDYMFGRRAAETIRAKLLAMQITE